MRAGLAGLDGFTIEDEPGPAPRGLPVPGLGHRARHDRPGRRRGEARRPGARQGGRGGWSAEEVTERGDWSVRRPALAPGGWAFEFENDWYPDIDDTAEVVLALPRTDRAGRPPSHRPRRSRGCSACSAATAGGPPSTPTTPRTLCRELPFCDFGELIDPPSADVTAHVVEMLADDRPRPARRSSAGVAWLLDAQEDDGSWFGRWGANHVYGTGAAWSALVAAGMDPADPVIGRAVAWLVAHQNDDGGWGEDLRSYDDPAWRGRGDVDGLPDRLGAPGAAGGAGATDAAERGVRYLVETQRPDGTWDEPWFTGTGFPRRLLHQLPPLPAGLPGLGPRPLPGERRTTVAELRVVSALRIEARAVGGARAR